MLVRPYTLSLSVPLSPFPSPFFGISQKIVPGYICYVKNIAVLIDFTEGSKMALVHAAALVKEAGATLFGIHVVSAPQKIADAERQLDAFIRENLPFEVPFEALAGDGSLVTTADNLLKRVSADLVIVCTHGVKGVVQHLFGAQILKLVQGISCPSIVIQEQAGQELVKTKKILLPIAPHPDFMVKVRQTAVLAKTLNASIVIYEINRPGSDFENLLTRHTAEAKQYFEEQGVPFTRVSEEVNIISAGYSRQTLEYAVKNNINVISLMATVSKNDLVFAMADKENFLVNSQGISILACI